MTIELLETDHGIGIPYNRCERVDGTNHGYVDLKKSPEKISLIPELEGYPELFRFVQDANAGISAFRTAGCSVRVSGGNESCFKYTSFVHLLFEILHWNAGVNSYRTLFQEFRTWVAAQRCQGPGASILFSLGPTSFWDHGFDGCSLRVYVEGRGGSEVEARSEWHAGLALLSLFLEEFSRAYQPQLRNCAKRVS